MTKVSKLNTDELRSFLIHAINNNVYLQEHNKVPVAYEVLGPAGIGKTSVIMQTVKELVPNCIKISLSQIEEISDLVGFPVRQFQLCKKETSSSKAPTYKAKIIEGKLVKVPITNIGDTTLLTTCLWVDEQAIETYTKQGYEFTGEKRMSYCPPEWIVDKKGGGCLILDDWTRASEKFIQAAMELINCQTYISWVLPKGWTILLSANPDEGSYNVASLDIAQETRYISTELKWDADCWARWAEKDGLDGRCINFLLLHQELVNEAVNARAITNFFNSISSLKDFSSELPLIQLLGEGSVGAEFANMFVMFINNKLDKLVKIPELLFNKDEEKMLAEFKKCVGSGKTYRADIASVLTTRLLNFCLAHAETNPIEPTVISRIINITKSGILTNDLEYHFIKGLIAKNKIKFQKILMDGDMIKIVSK